MNSYQTNSSFQNSQNKAKIIKLPWNRLKRVHFNIILSLTLIRPHVARLEQEGLLFSFPCKESNYLIPSFYLLWLLATTYFLLFQVSRPKILPSSFSFSHITNPIPSANFINSTFKADPDFNYSLPHPTIVPPSLLQDPLSSSWIIVNSLLILLTSLFLPLDSYNLFSKQQPLLVTILFFFKLFILK